MDKERYPVHIRHCCVLHGCKYGYEDCPVELGEVKQDYTCEYCSDDNLKSVEDVEAYNKMIEQVKQAKKEGQETLTVDTAALARMLLGSED